MKLNKKSVPFCPAVQDEEAPGPKHQAWDNTFIILHRSPSEAIIAEYRFVAMMIFTLLSTSKPSSWLRSSIKVLWISLFIFNFRAGNNLGYEWNHSHLSAEVPSENRLPPIASISSMKITQGCRIRSLHAHRLFVTYQLLYLMLFSISEHFSNQTSTLPDILVNNCTWNDLRTQQTLRNKFKAMYEISQHLEKRSLNIASNSTS